MGKKNYKTLYVSTPTFAKFRRAVEKQAEKRRRSDGAAAPVPTADEVINAALDALLGGGGSARSHHMGGRVNLPGDEPYPSAMASFWRDRKK